jgi:hypothetical protein
MAGKDRDEQDWLDLVSQVPCVICGEQVHVHHIREDQGIGKRAQHFLVAALCPEHHTGGQGFHTLGRRTFEMRFRMTELECMAETIRGVVRIMKGRAC